MAAKKKKSGQKPLPKGAKEVSLSKKKYMCYSKRVKTRKGMGTRGFCRAKNKAAPKRKGKK